ncbi:hypothetical protein V491_00957 [Pseudogymnoascus sp. VKM F-3775]|nr:hypothetical protein V491_00957 [Pseudogymnoascus sp. VKM F-3775]
MRPQNKRQGEIAFETWDSLYKDKDKSPTVLVQQIIDYYKETSREKAARLQVELDDALGLAAQHAEKIKNMKEAADLAVNGLSEASESGKPSGQTGSPSSKSAPEGPPKETWDATINKIGTSIHLLEAEEFYHMGDMKNLVRVAESAVTCAEKQPDKKLLAETWIWLGTGYSRRANLKSGMEAFTEALEAIKL